MMSSSNEKTVDWMQQRSLRRFPENNNYISSNNNSSKMEKQQNHSWSNRDKEQSVRKMHSLLSSSFMNSSNIHTSDTESLINSVFQTRVHSNSPPEIAPEEAAFNHTFSFKSSQTKTSNKIVPSETELTDQPPNKDTFIRSVLENGEYLDKYSLWHEFIGPEAIKKCSQKVITRNENIWELVSHEYSHLKMLLNIQDVYSKSYPYMEVGNILSTTSSISSITSPESSVSARSNSISEIKERSNNFFESIDSLLPGLDKIIEYQASICNSLINNHVIRDDRVITEIGRVLHEAIPDDFIPILTELYGRINYGLEYNHQILAPFKKYPVFLSYIHKCERDPKLNKMNLKDILTNISMRWTKRASTIDSIIISTVNDSQDLNNLIKVKEKINRIVNGASDVMENLLNAKLLLSLVENYDISPEVDDSERVYKLMTDVNAKLIYNSKVQFELKKSNNGQILSQEVRGVALEGCIFFLQEIQEPGKNSPKYQLFKERDSAFPAILEWGKLYGYFREEDSKKAGASSFYVIIEKPKPSIKRLFVNTPIQRSCWKKYMMQGLARWQSESCDVKDADNQLKEELNRIEQKWANTLFGIELIKNMDSTLRAQLEYRTVGFKCILEKQLERIHLANNLGKRNSISSIATVTDNDLKNDLDCSKPTYTDNFLPDLTTREGINDWLEMFMEWVNRLKFSLCSSGANITRSASEIEARKRPSIPTVKKCDTFSSRDSPTREKRQTDVIFLNPTITKQKKDQRRISVSGISNLFRISSKNVKSTEIDKIQEHTNISDTIPENSKDSSNVLNLEIISENDFFLSDLSKDTVIAFNEINMAAKNITVELLNLRSQNIILKTELKKNQEENHSFREFLLKYQKSAGEGHSRILVGNNSQLKTDSTNQSLGLVGLNSTGSTDLISEGLETLNENSSGFAHTDQKMVECRRQTENLRQMYDVFAKDKKKWEKEYESQRFKINRDKESLFDKNLELQKEKENLVEREKKYKDNCLNLQKKIDMYMETYGINLDDELIQHHVDGNLVSNVKLHQILQMQPHFRSHSDDISHKRSIKPQSSTSVPMSPPLASTEATSYKCDQAGMTDTTHSSSIPDQLRGSLINQSLLYRSLRWSKERQTLKTNSSDNILETRNKVTSASAPKTKMTPSIDRKEIYSSSNMCFSGDEKEDRDCSSDVDDFYPNTNVRCSTFDILQTRKSITSIISKTISISDNGKPVVRNSTVNSTTSSEIIPGNKFQGLGIPLALAAKSKVKKDKTKKCKI